MPVDIGDLLHLGLDVLSSKIDPTTGAMLVQLGDSTTGETESDGAEVWQQPGLASLPAAPTQGSASCQAIAIRRTDRDMVFAMCDKRATSIYGKMKPGETCVYATAGQARALFKADGHAVIYTTADNTPSGQTHAITLGPEGLQIMTKFGGITIDSNGITITSGQAALILSPTGKATLTGTQVGMHGLIASVCGETMTMLGTQAGLPTSIGPGLTSVLIGPAGPAGIGSSTVFCSP